MKRCRDTRLCRKFLEKSGSAKSKEMQDIAVAYVAVEAQMRSMSDTAQAAQVKAVHRKGSSTKKMRGHWPLRSKLQVGKW